jgi:predicted dehydrogenase
VSRPLRVGVIGCGGIAQMMHLPTLAERPDLFRIAGLADVSRPTLDAVGERYGVAYRTTDQRELIAHDEIDAVLVSASGSHREAALATFKAGKHLFVEKPLGFSLAETEEIARAAARSRGVVMVGYHKRYDPAYQKAAELVRSLSDLRFVEVTVLHPDDGAYRTHHAILPPRDGPWRELPEEIGRQALLEELRQPAAVRRLDSTVGRKAPVEARVAALLLYQSLIHDIDAVRGILGEPEAVVSAEVWQGGFAQTSLTRFPRDVRVALSWISLPGLKHYEERLRFVSPEARVTLVFPSPYLRHQPTPLTVERMDGGELVVEERTVSYEEAFRAELVHFRECVLEGHKPMTGIEDALGDARWIQAIAGAVVVRRAAPKAPSPRRSAAPARRRARSAARRSRRRS